MSKSEEIANELMNTQFGSTRHEAAAHILAQEAEIARLNKITLQKRIDRKYVDIVESARDQARDALRVTVEVMENLDHPDGCKSGYAKDTGEGTWFNEMWPEKCDCGRNAAIKQAKEILK